MAKVIFDTNTVRNQTSISSFIGGRNDLEKFSKVADILLPDIVIDEIRAQKRRHLTEMKNDFLSNPFHELMPLEKELTKAFKIDDLLHKIEKQETIKYQILTLSDEKALMSMRHLAIERKPPFEVESDKGFKDAYIYFTVLQFLKTTSSEEVYFVTHDRRLTEALSTTAGITVVTSYEDFIRQKQSFFTSDYFLSRLKDELAINAKAKSVTEVRININGDWVIKLQGEDSLEDWIIIDFASREIMSNTHGDYNVIVNEFIDCKSPDDAPRLVIPVARMIDLYAVEDSARIITAMCENEAIRANSGDEWIKDLYLKLMPYIETKASDTLIQKAVSYYGAYR